MSLIINPGSGGIELSGDGWTNSVEVARQHAQDWLDTMHTDGLREVQILPDVIECDDGRWTFQFQHTITKVIVELSIHGIDDMDKYMRGRFAHPRIYWNGSSSGEPSLADFAVEGWEPLLTFTKAN